MICCDQDGVIFIVFDGETEIVIGTLNQDDNIFKVMSLRNPDGKDMETLEFKDFPTHILFHTDEAIDEVIDMLQRMKDTKNTIKNNILSIN